jgi:aspartate aminotransferase-like enzyme
MISGIVNLTTGPVGISPEVMKALQKPPISHRSHEFKQLYIQTTELLSASLSVRETFLLTGSGTLANEAMLQEIKYISGRGLILSNGEFGNRLTEQARRINLNFITYQVEWGKIFDLQEIKNIISNNSIKWILFCHCETSTGVINNLNGLTNVAKRNDCLCFVDCMSTVGTMPLNLSNVAMATASSGKGLASIPGLAVVFSNIKPSLNKDTPVYLDLRHYSIKSGIPFTISSNLLKALYTSICQKLKKEQFELISEYGKEIFKILNSYKSVPFSNANTKVFTIVASEKVNQNLFYSSKDKHLLLSDESDYLKKRHWRQLATFGYYREPQLKYVLNTLKHSIL